MYYDVLVVVELEVVPEVLLSVPKGRVFQSWSPLRQVCCEVSIVVATVFVCCSFNASQSTVVELEVVPDCLREEVICLRKQEMFARSQLLIVIECSDCGCCCS
jgi:hypothetical protein